MSQVVEPWAVQKHILCIYYEVNTYRKFKTNKKKPSKPKQIAFPTTAPPPPKYDIAITFKTENLPESFEIFHLQTGVQYEAIFKKVSE